MKQLKAIFLDFDGVLTQSVNIKSDAFRTLYADQPEDVLAKIMAYHGTQDGISRVVKIKYCHEHFLGRPLSQQDLDQWVARYAQLVEKAVVRAPWVLGAKSLLASFHKSHLLFIVSGTPEDELKRVVEARQMTAYFKKIKGSPRSKADIVRDLMHDYELKPAECIFIGDAMADFEAAQKTGVAFLGRVDSDQHNPFPKDTLTISDLDGLNFK